MVLVPHATLAMEQLSLNHPGVHKKLGLPGKDAPLAAATSVATNTPGIALSDSPIKLQKISVQNLTPRELLVTLLQNGLAAEATDYLERAISNVFMVGHPTEAEDVDLLILASQWAGVAFVRQVSSVVLLLFHFNVEPKFEPNLISQKGLNFVSDVTCSRKCKTEFLGIAYHGEWAEGIVHLERVACLKEPEDPKSKSHYYDALVLLASALYNEGRKTEAAKCMAAAYNSDYNELLEQCENDEDNVASDLVDSRRRD
ncbi:hypothetical protein F0562_017995 [Nyssa sinensis]|uniref:Uncharacterized protein n=1 Tax=Nyssa sinensis TaxID=561372 RepID=A0A5J4ZAU9_9ASTE|nr:hypothetical protein F0562_017995 [Nyssa sinensis]